MCLARQDGVSATLEWTLKVGESLTMSSTFVQVESRIAPIRVQKHGCREGAMSLF